MRLPLLLIALLSPLLLVKVIARPKAEAIAANSTTDKAIASSPSAPRNDAFKGLTVYAYDAFLGKGSLGELMAETFRSRFGAETRFVSFSTEGEAVNQLALEAAKPRADLLVGVDEALLARAKGLGVFEALPKDLAESVPASLRFDPDGRFVPFDYGYVAFVYDSARVKGPREAVSRAAFLESLPARSVALQDPRTSSLGMAFLAAHPDSGFWKALLPKVLTVSPGWSGAYGLFLKGKVSYVVSYTTSPAYHREKENKDTFRAVLFTEGNYRQTEAVGLVKGSPRRDLALQWIRLLLSPEIQKALPLRQWMYPVSPSVELPASFRALPRPVKEIRGEPEAIGREKTRWIRQWTAVMAGIAP